MKMRIVFVGLCSSFTENMAYQDNMLAKAAADMGHEVVFISNAEKYIDGKMQDVSPCNIVIEKSIRLIRLPYVRIVTSKISKKIRIFRGVYKILDEVNPDIIFCHNHHYEPIVDVVKYKRSHPNVKVYADTHTSAGNSASNWLSLNVLHKVYYRLLTRKLVPILAKYFYIGEDEKEFAIINYGIPQNIMEYFPLGGFVLNEDEFQKRRNEKRNEIGVGENDVLFVHSGKIDKIKRSIELIKAFRETEAISAKMVIIGNVEESLKTEFENLVNGDERILFKGWLGADELTSYLCAGDVYCQPGSRSVTMQNAICCRNAIMAYPHPDYIRNLHYDCFYWCETIDDMRMIIKDVVSSRNDLLKKKNAASDCAREMLDYYTLLDKFIL